MTIRPNWTEHIQKAELLLLLLLPWSAQAQRFYDDDPIARVPPPLNVETIRSRNVSEFYDFLHNTFARPGERHAENRVIPAQGINTLGEVPDSAWYMNRHYKNRLTLEELVQGPGDGNGPSSDGVWQVVAAKVEGITPGFTILDSLGRRYILKFDPLGYPEMATAADVISSKFFHALGYFVPENYVVFFSRNQLIVGKGVMLRDRADKVREMTERDITEILLEVSRNKEGKYRAVASLYVSGKPLGPFRYYGTRKDDPNDVVPHEHRRDLRGLNVLAAWLGHDDSRSINTLDMLAEEDGIQHVKHYLIDFGSTLGSGSTRPNSPRSGHEYLFAWKPAALEFFTLGLFVPGWSRAHYPGLPAAGRFECKAFDAEKWVPEYLNPAFSNRLPDDEFWAAKQVMNFTDEEIRAIVRAGQLSNPEAENWIAECLIQRRDKIGRAFFRKVLPLDRFEVKGDHLVFEDLEVKYRLVVSRNYTIQWSRFNNETEQKELLAGDTSFVLPSELRQASISEFFAADIQGEDSKKKVTVYLRKKPDRIEVVGVDHSW